MMCFLNNYNLILGPVRLPHCFVQHDNRISYILHYTIKVLLFYLVFDTEICNGIPYTVDNIDTSGSVEKDTKQIPNN